MENNKEEKELRRTYRVEASIAHSS